MRFEEVHVQSLTAFFILDAYGVEMRRRYGHDAPYGPQHPPAGSDQPGGRFVVVLDEEEVPIACAALRRLDDYTAEVKSMFVRQEYRRRGVARELLSCVEKRAADLQYVKCRLNTGSNQLEALQLYLTAGYTPIERYNDNPYASFWFEKLLVPAVLHPSVEA